MKITKMDTARISQDQLSSWTLPQTETTKIGPMSDSPLSQSSDQEANTTSQIHTDIGGSATAPSRLRGKI